MTNKHLGLKCQKCNVACVKCKLHGFIITNAANIPGRESPILWVDRQTTGTGQRESSNKQRSTSKKLAVKKIQVIHNLSHQIR